MTQQGLEQNAMLAALLARIERVEQKQAQRGATLATPQRHAWMHRVGNVDPLYVPGNGLGQDIIVAASNAPATWKNAAGSYVCGGANDEKVIQAAINALPAAGGAIILSPGTFTIAQSITISNGAEGVNGTRHAVALLGSGSGDHSDIAVNGATRIVWAGANDGVMVQVNGPTFNFRQENIHLDCAGIAKTGLKLISSNYTDLNHVLISRYGRAGAAGLGLEATTRDAVGANGRGGTNIHADYLVIEAPQHTGSVGMRLLGGANSAWNTSSSVFHNFTIIGGSAGYAVELEYADSNYFGVGLLYTNGGSCVRFTTPAATVPGNTDYPHSNVFDGTMFSPAAATAVSGTSGAKGNMFLPFRTADGHNIDGTANTYGFDLEGNLWAGTGFQVRGPSNATDPDSMRINGPTPKVIAIESDGGADGKRWEQVVNSAALTHRLVNDANNAATVYLNILRSGMNLVTVDFRNTRSNHAQGASVAAANNLTLGNDGNLFHITGATQINLIDTTNWQAGSEVTLIFDSNPLVKDNQLPSGVNKPIRLSGSVDFVTAANSRLVLTYDGTYWWEIARTVA